VDEKDEESPPNELPNTVLEEDPVRGLNEEEILGLLNREVLKREDIRDNGEVSPPGAAHLLSKYVRSTVLIPRSLTPLLALTFLSRNELPR